MYDIHPKLHIEQSSSLTVGQIYSGKVSLGTVPLRTMGFGNLSSGHCGDTSVRASSRLLNYLQLKLLQIN